jgi:hypothetical protein
MIKMKYIEDDGDLEFPYCRTINDNNSIPLSIQNKSSTSIKKKYLYIIIIILCIIIVGLSIFLIVYFSQKKDKIEIIINPINNAPPKENYIIAKYHIESNNDINLFNIPKNSNESNFNVNEIVNGVRILEENNNSLYNENDTYFYNSSGIDKNITIIIRINNALESISHMFQNCTNLVEVNFSKFISNNIRNIESTFSNCASLNSVYFTNFNSSNIETMDNAFENCESLTELNLSSFTTTNLQTMNSMFKNCKSLNFLNLSNFELNENISFNDVFLNVNQLILISKYNNTREKLGKNAIALDVNCTVGKNDSCKTCNEKENKPYFCGDCNDGYTLFNITIPTKCNKCVTENCLSCEDVNFCTKCIEGYHLLNNTECSIDSSTSIPTTDISISTTDIIIPKKDIIISTSDIIIPTTDITTPTTDITTPTTDITTPTTDITTPTTDITTPTTDITTPTTDIITPTIDIISSISSTDISNITSTNTNI